jgi:hypothetical protein
LAETIHIQNYFFAVKDVLDALENQTIQLLDV